MTQTCKIQWIDNRGQSTPDNNPAIALVRTRERHQTIHGRQCHFPASDWYPICAEHARRLEDDGMHIWERKEI